MLPPHPPTLFMCIHPHSTATYRHIFFQSTRYCWKAWANKKVFRWDWNWDNVGTFLRVAGNEFQRDGAMKLKECCVNDLSFCFGILSSISCSPLVKSKPTWHHTQRSSNSKLKSTPSVVNIDRATTWSRQIYFHIFRTSCIWDSIPFMGMLAHLSGTICLKHSATLILPPLSKPPSRSTCLITISKLFFTALPIPSSDALCVCVCVGGG